MRFNLPLNFLLILIAGAVYGQATMTTSGNWTTTSNWTSGNIGDVVTETVTINNNVNPTLTSPTNLTVGSTTFNNNNTLTINSGATLNIGDATHANSLTSTNGTTLTIDGTLIVWGDLVVNNNLTWNISGTVIIKGNVTLNNGAGIDVTGGTLQVSGNFTGGNNTSISLPSGSISIGGNLSVGNGSSASVCTGCMSTGGSCSGPSGFCSSGVLPITLVSFEGKATGTTITLDWTTASELNFDKFVVERSADALNFTEIGTVPGHGTSNEENDYSFEDNMPATGSNYYRLHSVDYDGNFENSKVIRVQSNGSAEKIRLFPNPVTDGVFSVTTSFARQEGDKVMIYNNVGMLVGETSVDSKEITIGKTFTTGLYTLFYVSSTERYALRFVVK